MDSSAVYTDSVFSQNKSMFSSRKSEFKVKLSVSKDGSVSVAVPLFAEDELKEISGSKDYNYVHFGAILTEINPLFRARDTKGICLLVDTRFKSLEEGLLSSFEFSFSSGRVAFAEYPSFSMAKEDVLAGKDISIFIKVFDVGMIEGTHPISVSTGVIYGLMNTEHPTQLKLTNSAERKFQPLIGSDFLDLKALSSSTREELLSQLGQIGGPSNLSPKTKMLRRKPFIGREKPPMFLRDYRDQEVKSPVEDRLKNLLGNDDSEARGLQKDKGRSRRISKDHFSGVGSSRRAVDEVEGELSDSVPVRIDSA